MRDSPRATRRSRESHYDHREGRLGNRMEQRGIRLPLPDAGAHELLGTAAHRRVHVRKSRNFVSADTAYMLLQPANEMHLHNGVA